MAEQTIYDEKRDGLYRDRARDFMIHKEVRSKSMTTAHYHPYYELFYVTKGNCRMFVGHSLFTVTPGDGDSAAVDPAPHPVRRENSGGEDDGELHAKIHRWNGIDSGRRHNGRIIVDGEDGVRGRVKEKNRRDTE